MKIYVSLPLKNGSKDIKSFTKGLDSLKKLGYNILMAKEAKVKESSNQVFALSERYIKEADIVITEASKIDSKVGYEVASSFNEKKTVIVFENEKNKEINPIIHGNKNKALLKKKYSDDNAVEVMDKAVKEAARKLDSKFILIISPEIDRYLDWSSKSKRMHKAQVVREAIETVMTKDRGYKESLKVHE